MMILKSSQGEKIKGKIGMTMLGYVGLIQLILLLRNCIDNYFSIAWKISAFISL